MFLIRLRYCIKYYYISDMVYGPVRRSTGGWKLPWLLPTPPCRSDNPTTVIFLFLSCQHEGQYCWQDQAGKKHYKLRTHHLKALVKSAEQGGIIETHDDIPNNMRDQLYAEEHQRLSRQNKSSNNMPSGSTPPQINIHVLSTQSSQPLVSASWGTELLRALPKTILVASLDLLR